MKRAAAFAVALFAVTSWQTADAAPAKGQDAGAKALSERIRMIKANDANAQLQLGLDLRNGKGLKKDPVLAYKWIRQAAQSGLAEAQFIAGEMDLAGEGTPRKAADGIDWFKKAAKLGYGPANARLAAIYRYGEGVPFDLVQSARYYREMAERNDVPSQLILADCYLHGAGVLKSPIDAAVWLRRAALYGSEEARVRLALLLLDAGKPNYALQRPSRNSREAVTWLQLSADDGYAPAPCR
jgi:TPR repeat protein